MLGERVTAIGGALAAGRGRMGQHTSEALIWASVAIAAILLLGVVVLLFRRHALNAGAQSQSNAAMEEIDRLHKEGLLTDEEYRRARRAALGLTVPQAEQADAEAPPDADADTREEDAPERG